MNPALELYEYWRAIAKYKMESQLDDARSRHTPGYRDYERMGHVLDRRCGLRISGVDANGEPIIQMGTTYRSNDAHVGSNLNELFTLWSDGTFQINSYPGFRAIHKHTFVHWSWAQRDRVFVVVGDQDARKNGEIYRWANLEYRDYRTRQLYVPFYSGTRQSGKRPTFPGDYKLTLVETDHGWRITSPDSHQQTLLNDGYGVAEQRYARHERAAELAANPTHVKRITGDITTGRLTATETVARMAGLLKVYDPRP